MGRLAVRRGKPTKPPRRRTQAPIKTLKNLEHYLTADDYRDYSVCPSKLLSLILVKLSKLLCKYLWRLRDKGETLKDAKKARFYIDRLIQMLS